MPDFPVGAETLAQAKNAARRRLLAARAALPPTARTSADADIQAATIDLVRTTASRRVATYLPIGDEPGGPGLVDALGTVLPSGALLLPVLLADLDLDWAAHTGDLAPGRFGLREPTGPRLGPEALAGVDLIVVPAVAVDRHGTRLGRGGGSYDRALARAPHVRAVALLYDGEFVTELPSGTHDRPVTGIITPSSGYVGWTK